MSKPIGEKVAIIAAGPGGLAAAIALQKQGFNVQVYEKAQEFRPAGTGLGLLPNGLNCLEAIEPGLVETLKRSGCQVRQYELAHDLSHSSSIEEAFCSYEKRRIECTQIIQSRSALGEMRYYETDSETSSRQSSPQATNNDFQDWLCNYKPSVNG